MSSLDARTAALHEAPRTLTATTDATMKTAHAAGAPPAPMNHARAFAYVAAVIFGLPLGLLIGIIAALLLGFETGGMVC